MENELLCSLALNAAFGYEPHISRRLIDHLGSAAAVFALTPAERAGLLGPKAALLHEGLLEKARQEWQRIEGLGCRFVPLTDPAFPPLLKECPDAPVGLYVRSETPPERLFANPHPVAVIGTRDISPYGKAVTEQLVAALAGAGVRPCIVSGLAFGVDITAHEAALARGLPTIAVLPVGIDEVYPWRHRDSAARIAAAPDSALVSDFPPG
ncbi:MAG: DNA-processing protein DprA, partial [Bacteroidales bacterium]|nr:DNA-processing protein DprA [Bacteroidales bacterium]